jgi:hypothetical protein
MATNDWVVPTQRVHPVKIIRERTDAHAESPVRQTYPNIGPKPRKIVFDLIHETIQLHDELDTTTATLLVAEHKLSLEDDTGEALEAERANNQALRKLNKTQLAAFKAKVAYYEPKNISRRSVTEPLRRRRRLSRRRQTCWSTRMPGSTGFSYDLQTSRNLLGTREQRFRSLRSSWRKRREPSKRSRIRRTRQKEDVAEAQKDVREDAGEEQRGKVGSGRQIRKDEGRALDIEEKGRVTHLRYPGVLKITVLEKRLSSMAAARDQTYAVDRGQYAYVTASISISYTTSN